MATILAFPIFGLLVILQSTIVSRVQLGGGAADLVLLVIIAWSLQEQVEHAWIWALIGSAMVAFVSAVPVVATVAGYLIAMVLGRFFHRRIWQAPVLAMFVTTAISTVLQHLIIMTFLNINYSTIALGQGFTAVTLPGAFLNLVLALPVYALVTDFAKWVYPVEDEL